MAGIQTGYNRLSLAWCLGGDRSPSARETRRPRGPFLLPATIKRLLCVTGWADLGHPRRHGPTGWLAAQRTPAHLEHPLDGTGDEGQAEHGDHVEAAHVKHLDGGVGGGGGRQGAVCRDGQGRDGADVRAILLGELDAARHLLPELEHAIRGGGEEEVRAAGHGDSRHGVAVHVAALVHGRQGEGGQVLGLVLQGLHGCRVHWGEGWEMAAPPNAAATGLAG